METIIQGSEITKYIPQQPPFVMVDKLYTINEKQIHTGLTVEDGNMLVSNETFQESGLVENMAQSTALFAGFLANKLGKTPPIGFIAGIKDLEIFRLPAVGETIFTKVELTNEVMEMQIVQAESRDSNEQLLGRCEMRIFIKPE